MAALMVSSMRRTLSLKRKPKPILSCDKNRQNASPKSKETASGRIPDPRTSNLRRPHRSMYSRWTSNERIPRMWSRSKTTTPSKCRINSCFRINKAPFEHRETTPSRRLNSPVLNKIKLTTSETEILSIKQATAVEAPTPKERLEVDKEIQPWITSTPCLRGRPTPWTFWTKTRILLPHQTWARTSW